MPIVGVSQPTLFATPAFPVRRFSVDEYHRMIDANVLTEDDRVELLEGWIVPQMVRRPRHDAAIELVQAALRRMLPAGCRLRIQSAITTGDSEPEPDLAIVQGDVRDHIHRHPRGDETILVVEVAETTLTRDRDKRRIYARANVPQYWILNLIDEQLEIYSQPETEQGNAEYAVHVVATSGQQADVEMADNAYRFAISELLP